MESDQMKTEGQDCTRRIALALSVALLVAAVADRTRAETILTSKEGNRLIGGSVQSEDDQTVVVDIYRGLCQKIPKPAIAAREDVDRSQRVEREEFARRLQALATDNVAGRLELATWAREKGLVVQAQGLLMELQERFPANPGVQATFPAQPRRTAHSAEEKAFLVRQVAAYFAEGGKPDDALAALAGKDALPEGTAEEWARLCLDEARKGAKVQEGDSRFKNGPLENDLHIEPWRKPQPAAPEAGKAPVADDTPWPVLVTLHGGGKGSGHWSSGTGYFNSFRGHFDKLLFVAPTVMQKNYAEWAGNPDEERQFREILRAVKRTWKVDTDRVYLAGFSMGGYGTWHFGGHQADQFAGLVAGAGGILIGEALRETWGWGIVGNLMHTPIAFVHGGKDGQAPPWSDAECDRILSALAAEQPDCYRHLYKFCPDNGHAVGDGGAVAWVAGFRRNPYPKKVCWEPKREFNKQFYWLQVRKPQIFTRLEAEVKDNAVSVKTLNLNGGFSVLLNRQLVDLSKPVTVDVDGKRVFAGIVPETLSTILATVGDRIDERQWFSARIDF